MTEHDILKEFEDKAVTLYGAKNVRRSKVSSKDLRVEVVNKLAETNSTYPKDIVLLHDVDVGFVLNIDCFSLDFGNDAEAARREAIRYLNAMHNNKVHIKRRRFQKWITLGKDLTIVD